MIVRRSPQLRPAQRMHRAAQRLLDAQGAIIDSEHRRAWAVMIMAMLIAISGILSHLAGASIVFSISCGLITMTAYYAHLLSSDREGLQRELEAREREFDHVCKHAIEEETSQARERRIVSEKLLN